MVYVAVLIMGLIVGTAIGAIGGVLIARLRQQASSGQQQADLAARAVAGETRSSELAGLLAHRDEELTTARGQLSLANVAKAEALTRLEEASRNVAEQKRLLDAAQEQLVNVFKSLSADALKSNSDEFRKLAQSTLAAFIEQAKGDLGKREEAIKTLVSPLSQSLTAFDQQLRLLEAQRKQDYGGLKQYFDSVTGSQQQLTAETRKLVAALSQPKARGNWGELQLRRVVEVAGMSDHCDFTEQVTVDSEQGKLRPDMIVCLPGGRQIVVDAKAPMTAYLAALSAETEEARQAALANHARQIRQHMTQLASKRYFEQFERTPEMVVLFIPGESFFSAALDCDQTLIEDGAAQRVVLASPTTLIALLRAIAYGWQQESVARNAEQIRALGKDIYERLRTLATHLATLQKRLGSTVNAFNEAIGSFESRVVPSARRFKELGAGVGDELTEVEPIDQTPRELPALPSLPSLPDDPTLPPETAVGRPVNP